MDSDSTSASKKIGLPLFFISLIVVALVSSGGVCLWQKYHSQPENLLMDLHLQPTPTVSDFIPMAPDSKEPPQINDFSAVEEIFNNISDGAIPYSTPLSETRLNNQNGFDQVYQSEYLDLSKYISNLSQSVYILVDVYKYEPGTVLYGAYEGFDWQVNMDQWKNWLQSLKIGKNMISAVCSDGGCSKLESPQSVIVKGINKNKYVVSDGSFRPAGTLNRNYTTYDSKNNAIIDVRLDYYVDRDNLEILGIFSKIENLLP
jgi:hypothetical protein